jgi:hypothetical protein
MRSREIFFLLAAGIFLLSGCVPYGSNDRIDCRNFAIDTYTPTPNELRLGEEKVRLYLAKHGTGDQKHTSYLAIQVSKVFPSEIVQNLWPKLINSETATSFFSRGHTHNPHSDLDLSGIMIFDTRSNHFVGRTGYVLVDTPARGKLARFGDYIARYIR